jgi:hypothetical protein
VLGAADVGFEVVVVVAVVVVDVVSVAPEVVAVEAGVWGTKALMLSVA